MDGFRFALLLGQRNKLNKFWSPQMKKLSALIFAIAVIVSLSFISVTNNPQAHSKGSN
jgi:hypothetical protein